MGVLVIENRKYLFFSVFVAGMTTLAVEFTASRMLQTIFGTSNIVWANVIGLVLLFLTVGYFVGGRIADKNPSEKLFYWLVAMAGFSSVFFLLLTSVVLRATTSTLALYNVGSVVSSFIVVLIALAVPITLLGCLSPFAIRLGVRNINEAGQTSGRIYAISTWGSLLGTYLPVLWVIPTAGSRMTAVIFGSFLMLTGLVGVWQRSSNKLVPALLPILLIPFAFYWTSGNVKNSQHQIYEEESAYNYISVGRSGDCNYLYLNEGAVVHSEYCDNDRIQRYTVYERMLSAPYFNNPSDIENIIQKPVSSLAVIGLGAGMIPKRFQEAFGGEMTIDGIELDPKVVTVAQKYFDMTDPKLNIIVGDGRYELNQLDSKYDIIAIDAYKPPYIPWHLTTEEFFSEVKLRLTKNGSVAINVFRLPNDRSLVKALTSTLLQVYPSVHTVDIGDFNTALIATVQPTKSENLKLNADKLGRKDNKLLRTSLHLSISGLVPNTSSDIVFTDEIAPLETLIDSMLFRYILKNAVQPRYEESGDKSVSNS